MTKPCMPVPPEAVCLQPVHLSVRVCMPRWWNSLVGSSLHSSLQLHCELDVTIN